MRPGQSIFWGFLMYKQSELFDFNLTVFESIVDNIPSAVFLKDASDGFRIKIWNKAAEITFEMPKSEILGKTTHEKWSKELADLYTIADLEVAKNGRSILIEEEPCYSPARGDFYLRTQKIPLRVDNQNEVKYLLCICDDITEQKKTKQKTDEILNQLKEAQSIAKIGSWSFDLINNHQVCSSEQYKIIEIDESEPQEMLYKTYRDRVFPEDLAELDFLANQAKTEGVGFIQNHRLRMPKGLTKYIRSIAYVAKDNMGKPVKISGTCQDITREVETEQQSDFMLKTLGLGIWKYYPGENKLDWDSNMYKLVGLCDRQLPDAHRALASILSTEAREKLFKEMSALLSGKKDYNVTFEIHSPNKGKKYLGSRATVVREASGTPLKVYGICFDRTQEVELEMQIDKERAKTQLNAKLACLGEISAGIAHEINNPLAIISSSVALLEKQKNDPEKFKLKINGIKRSIDRIVKIISGLKKFSRSSAEPNFQPIILSKLITESMVLIEGKAKKYETDIQLDISSQSMVLCDEIEIEQVLVNLINNAIDAVKDQPEKWVKVSLHDFAEELVLQVEDSGLGISTEIEDKLFQPFFTTKPVGEGTGIGLSIVKGILDQHNASIGLNRNKANTCFEVHFPKYLEKEISH